jgi:hypothetical protein
MDATFAERVKRGAALLDEVNPDWYRTVAVHRLVMSDCHRCMLGQLFNSYQQGCLMLQFRGDQAKAYGFVAEDGYEYNDAEHELYGKTQLLNPNDREDFETERMDYLMLAAYWEDAIRDRKRQHAARLESA